MPRRFPAVTILFATSILVTHYALIPDGEHSHYIDSYGLKTKEIPTWFTYTFLHSNSNHLLWNVIPISVTLVLVEIFMGWRIALFCILFTILFIPVTFLVIEQMETASGVEAISGHGASGIKFASGVFLVMQSIRWLGHKFDKLEPVGWIVVLMLYFLTAISIWSIFDYDGTSVSDVAHIAGYNSGVLVFLIYLIYMWKKRAKSRINDDLRIVHDSYMQ